MRAATLFAAALSAALAFASLTVAHAQDYAAILAAPAKAKGRLSFKQKHALETIPPRIEAFRAQQALLQRKLDDPNFYKKDQFAFAKATTDYGDLQVKIDKLEQEWLELEMLREELEG